MSRVGGEEHTISMISKEAPTGRSLRPEAQTSILGLNRGFTALSPLASTQFPELSVLIYTVEFRPLLSSHGVIQIK